MSSRDRLTRLTADVIVPPAQASATVVSAQAGPGTMPDDALPSAPAADQLESSFPALGGRLAGRRTGPGELLAFRGQMMETEGELARLRDQLRLHEGSSPTRKLDPGSVVPSRWANRYETSFSSPEFVRFKADLEHAGGNVQPILVRVLETAPDRFEVIFGHRRHRACLDLGLPVLATIHTGTLSELDVFAAMDRENRERADLSPWEQGMMYRKALDEGMFPSQRRLAETLGVSHTWVRMALAVAEIPAPILACFRSPLELQVRLATEISAALQADRKGVLRRAEKLVQLPERLAASAVVAALVGKARATAQSSREIKVRTKVAGRVSWDARGQAVIRLLPGVLHPANVDAVLAAIVHSLGDPDTDVVTDRPLL
jgi:ParB family chromosome partitioning protein